MNKQEAIFLITLAALLYLAPWAAFCLYALSMVQKEYKHFFEHKDTQSKLEALEHRMKELEKVDRFRSINK